MQVFRLCLMILKKKMPILLIYVFVFLGVLFIVASNFNRSPQQAAFSKERIRIALLTQEEGPLIAGLREELSKTADIVPLMDNPEALQDALFFHSVSAILRIPQGFEPLLMNAGTPIVESITAPQDISGMHLDLLINQYLNTVRIHASVESGLTAREIADRTAIALAVTTPVEMRANDSGAAALPFTAYYFNYLSYVYLSVFILGISALMVVFNHPDLRRRNACSPLPAGRVNVQFLLANLLFTFVVWLVMGATFFLLNMDRQLPPNLPLFYLNAFLYAFCAASISYLIGTSMKGDSAVSAVSNIVSLGTSFLCGVFVPQALISASVLRVARFTPTYWYVRANNLLAETALSNTAQLRTFLSFLLIQAGFGVACLVMALVIGRKKNLRMGGA